MEIDFEVSPYTRHKLDLIYQRFYNKLPENSHNALGDCKTTLEILKKYNEINPKLLILKSVNYNRFKRS
jgi:hypothetical protein